MITVILNAYKRNYFGIQLEALMSQTVKPTQIYIWQNESFVDLTPYKAIYGDSIKIIKSEVNFKYWGRFSLGYLCNTEYIMVLDDDMIPGKLWIENCLRLHKEKNAMIGANGRDFNNKNNAGDGGKWPVDTKCAFVGHSWFFKKEWLKYMWMIEPMTYETGEDMHFCACLKIFGNIESWIPQQYGETSACIRDFSDDKDASYRDLSQDRSRTKITEYLKSKGWA